MKTLEEVQVDLQEMRAAFDAAARLLGHVTASEGGCYGKCTGDGSRPQDLTCRSCDARRYTAMVKKEGERMLAETAP